MVYTYYLCNDNETIYRIEFSLKQEDIKKYLSLLENYLTEFIFLEETEFKKLVEKEKIKKDYENSISTENYFLFLQTETVIETEKIEDYLPFVVTIKKKTYMFLRSYSIYILIKLLSKYLDKISHPHLRKIENLLGVSQYLDFNLLLTLFFDESGSIFPERMYDYQAFLALLKDLKGKITERYSRSSLVSFWQGDEAERAIADWIVEDSAANKNALKKINFSFHQNLD